MFEKSVENTNKKRNDKLKKTKKIIFIIALIIIASGINIITWDTVKSIPLFKSSENTEANIELYATLEKTTDEVVEYFIPEMEILDNIQLRFISSLEINEQTDNGNLIIELNNEEDEQIWNTEISIGQIADLQYETYSVDLKLDTEKVYHWIIYWEKPDKSNGLINYPLTNARLLENKKCIYNGTEVNQDIDIIYQYKYYDTKSFRIIICIDIFSLLLGIFLYNKFYTKKVKRNGILQKAIWMVIPVAMYVLYELIVGNLFTIKGKYLCINIIIFYYFYIMSMLVIGRVRIASMIYMTILSIFSLIEYYVLLFRGRPFVLEDLTNARTAATVVGTYNFQILVETAVYLLIILNIIMIIYFSTELYLPKSFKRSGCGIGMCIFLFVCVNTRFLQTIHAEQINFWDINSDYQNKGSWYTLILECQYNNIKRPKGYSAKNVQSIVNDDESASIIEIKPENIIVIMNESFADLNHISKVKTNTEVLSHWNSITDNVTKGWLQVPVFGAGTAESEYEMLTGNTKQFLALGSTAYKLYCHDPEYSLTWTLKNQGYKTIALHPYYGDNWERTTVYPKMGFDQFISAENWGEETDNIRWCASDTSAYKKVEELIANKEKGEKIFTFLVTLQNHGGYGEDSLCGYESKVALDYNQKFPFAETYLSLIEESDNAFNELIEFYKTNDEPTMIVMFGDHYPALDEKFYEELYGKELNELELEETQLMYQTPYMIWTNYERESNLNIDMSANYLSSYILKEAGLELTSYNQFLLDLQKELNIIGMGAVCDSNEKWYDIDELPDKYNELINNYRILQYNNVVDRKHLCTDIFSLTD